METIGKDQNKSFSFLALRFTAFILNALFVCIFMVCVYLGGMILLAIISLRFENIDGVSSILVPAFIVICPVSAFLFQTYKTSGGRQTIGNKSMGLVVVDKDGAFLHFSKSVVRCLLWIVSALTCGLGLLWALIDPSGRGWHDMIMGTRIVRTQEEDVHIPAMAFLSFILGFLSLLIFSIPLLNVIGVMSSLAIMWMCMVILCILIPLALIIGVIYKIIARIKKEKSTWGQRFAQYGIRIALLTGIMFLFLAVAIPSSSNIFRLNREIECEKDMRRIGETIENFERDQKALPENLMVLMEHGYLEELPTFGFQEEYVYRIEMDHERKYFVLECPSPQTLLKGRCLLPPRKCQEIRYIQGKGLIIKTE